MKHFKVSKTDYPREAIIISLQRYLEKFWITISEKPEQYIVTFDRKTPMEKYPKEKEFMNHLIESEFIRNKVKESLRIREQIISTALGPYMDGSNLG